MKDHPVHTYTTKIMVTSAIKFIVNFELYGRMHAHIRHGIRANALNMQLALTQIY